MPTGGTGDTDELLAQAIRRTPILQALAGEPKSRSELEAELGVSKATVHRVTTALSELGLLERRDGTYCLTALGRAVAEEVAALRDAVSVGGRIWPILEAARDHDVAVDLGAFADATVTVAGPGDPYAPVNRFMSLVGETDTLRGLDPTTITPVHVDALSRRIADGMVTEGIYPPETLENMVSTYPERTTEVLASGNLSLLTCPEIPFGLTLCDDRVGVGGYDPETGALAVYVDTDDPEALEWAETVYTKYRARAEPLESVAPEPVPEANGRGEP